MRFEIRGGNCDGKVVSFICTLPTRKNGRWAGIAPASRYFRAWVVAAGGPPKRRDRMGLDVFRNRLFEIDVRTVDHDARRSKEHPEGRPLPPAAQYSVVDRLVERLA